MKVDVDAEHIVHDQNLPVDTGSGADTDHRYLQRGGDLAGKCGGYLFEHERKAAALLEQIGVFHQFAGL